VDINPDAAGITQACLYMKVNHDKRYLGIILQNIKIGNSIIGNKSIDSLAFDWRQEYPYILENGGFDFIVGNPPYVTLQKNSGFDPAESIYSQIVDGPANAATLMIGRSIELLKPGGLLAFLLPRTILYVDSYNKLRSYLLQNTHIVQIIDLGAKFKDVRGEQVVLIVKKQKPEKTQQIQIVDFSLNASLFEQTPLFVSQAHLQSTNQFPTFNSYSYYGLIEKLSSIGSPLESVVSGKIFRGIPVGGNQLCDKCSNSVEAIRGKSISKFKIRNIMQLENAILAKQSRLKTESLKTKKLVLQNIFSSESGIIAAYDAKGIITLDTVTNICVSDDAQGKYLLALLNSKVINFYLIYGVFNQSKLTMHLDRSYLGRIPIITNPDTRRKKKIIEIVESILDCEDKRDLKPKISKIDEIVYGLYSLKSDEIELIEQAMAKMLSRKSIW
jgi:type I restriction-modification system DNA methylase subunit